MEYLLPTNNIVFKRLFGDAHNADILLAFLNAVLEDVGEAPLAKTKLFNPHLHKKTAQDKQTFLDIIGYSADGELVNLEILVSNQQNMQKSPMLNWAELYVGQMVKEKSFSSLHRTITITILDFIYLPSKQAHSLYQLREHQTKHLFTNYVEIHFLELPKLEKTELTKRTPLMWWGLFLQGIQKDRAEEFRLYNPIMKKAVDMLETISKDIQTSMLYNARQKAIHDEVSRMADAQSQGRAEGIVQSIQHLWLKRFGKMSEKEEKALYAASSEALAHILDQMLDAQYTVEQARMDLSI